MFLGSRFQWEIFMVSVRDHTRSRYETGEFVFFVGYRQVGRAPAAAEQRKESGCRTEAPLEVEPGAAVGRKGNPLFQPRHHPAHPPPCFALCAFVAGLPLAGHGGGGCWWASSSALLFSAVFDLWN